MQKNPAPALVLWIISAHIFMGVVAYEWLPATYRGSWIFLLLLVIAGAYLNIGMALILGLVAFVGIAFYFFLDLANQTYIERQLLLLFVAPLAPVFLSAIRHNIKNALASYRAIQSYDRNYQHDILPLTALKHFQDQLKKLLQLTHKNHYEVISIQITNTVLIREMLGEDIWKETQNKIMTILSTEGDSIIYHFINEELSEIKSIVIHENQMDEQHPTSHFLQQLQELNVLKLKVEQHTEYLSQVDREVH
ncbi:hypothetical protein L313_3106 [Acinetobacter haemolyticus CIP 64.3 = MTCC 9819]|uniref:Uncharacterized protein n=1 Tax=Acinetobacter haemolyticus CIP 64.3 = MTCC 9819 TaxID=1217659 RepID=N9GKY5_ACIHA|nr:hypothetical protein [Acinetobacter haemolyticus]ENW17799.1 hypothetical protein F927_01872 [Acinetobacter haemolyticus CIP 64.3 = MTCC 9819]EPR87912.1 hypothetical protein L313_3106 [Acinetobacter haemolyticus CIP 64.3 = MTCC 9819]QXZ25524.1 hypothetical protein I6L22_09790 [Acinetobacter haemolyticus]SPT47988.1 Uncharacterised protein [Acinetobacter haemolyticus]SUU57222.1 Uncharacterised protein [Acinetobacter haemolyticus]